MMDVNELVQKTIDDALFTLGVRTYEGKRQDDTSADEYVVFTINGDDVEVSADGATLARTSDIIVRYYLVDTLAYTRDGKRQRNARIKAVLRAMIEAGFDCQGGWAAVSDIDKVGFDTWVAQFEFVRMTDV